MFLDHTPRVFLRSSPVLLEAALLVFVLCSLCGSLACSLRPCLSALRSLCYLVTTLSLLVCLAFDLMGACFCTFLGAVVFVFAGFGTVFLRFYFVLDF